MSISIHGITKKYGSQLALDNVSLDIPAGQVVGLLGPNGAGKTTLMKIVTGYVRPDSGTVSVCGLDIDADPMALRRTVGYLPEHNPLYPDMYVGEYLAMVAGMYGVTDKSARIGKLVEMTGLSPEAHKKIGQLSKGYRQRVGIAQALMGDPRVVIFDEPTTGLDPNQVVEVRELIRGLASDRTVVLSTHIMQEVEAICDNLVIIDHGHIRARGSVGEVLGMSAGGQVVDVEFGAAVDPGTLASELGAEVVSTSRGRFRLTASASDDDLRLTLFRFAAGRDIPLLHLAKVEDIEDVFHKLTTQDDKKSL